MTKHKFIPTVVRFDVESYDYIRKKAFEEHISLSEAIRVILKERLGQDGHIN